jgi:carboxypeptidase D
MSLTLPAVAAEKTQADYFVHSLPGQPEGPLLKMHAGYASRYEFHPFYLLM